MRDRIRNEKAYIIAEDIKKLAQKEESEPL